MSHIVTISTVITNLAALKAAALDLGAVWNEGKTTYNWFGRSVGDYPLPKGMTAAMLGKCEHAISLPGVNYEIGVVKLPDSTYTLAFDFYGSGLNGNPNDGKKLKEHFGDKLGKLTDYYQHHCLARPSVLKGRKCWKITSNADAEKVSKLTGQKITYAGQMLTVVGQP